MKERKNFHNKLKAPFPEKVMPMLSTLADRPPLQGEWIYEIKWDGYRAISLCNENKVSLVSRNNKSFDEKYYPIKKTLESLKLQAVLDGEIVVLKDNGLPSFEDLQGWRSEADGELVYYVFDLLWLNGKDLTKLPLHQRKEILRQIISTEGMIRMSPVFEIVPQEFLKAVQESGLEGMMAKRADSLYFPGVRSEAWLKIKTQNAQEVVIGGYTKNEHSPKLFSALLVGVYDKGVLQYCGKIGTGFNDKAQKEMMARFKSLVTAQCPFSFVPDINKASRFRPNPPLAEAVWLKPQLVCEVYYREMTSEGVMRHPSFKGMREDKEALDIHLESSLKSSPIIPHQKLKIPKASLKERRTLLNPTEETQVKKVNGHELKFNHLGKLFWPRDGLTKRDLLNYYYQIAPYIHPYLLERPQSLNRFPNGIEGVSFYQKDVTGKAPEWMEKFPYKTSQGENKNYLIVQSEYDLLWMANLGAIEMNPWNSTIMSPEHPSWCIIDLDPSEGNTFEQVIEAAQATKEVLDGLKIKGYCKTSGATGLHIYIPMGAKYTYEQCQLFARMIATHVHQILPKLTSIERLTANRKGKIYVDFLQNRPKATLAAPYSVRPQPGAPVSMPLQWEEVQKGLSPEQFTLKNALQRVEEEGDLFKAVLGKGINLEKILKQFE